MAESGSPQHQRSGPTSAVLTTGQTGHWPGPPSCWGPPTDATNFFTHFLKVYMHFCQQKECVMNSASPNFDTVNY